MGSKIRVRVRVRGGVLVEKASERVPLWNYEQLTGKWREWQFREQLTIARGERLVDAGKAERIERMVDGLVRTVGYRMRKARRLRRCSPCTLTFGVMQAVADAADGDARDTRRAQVVKFHVWNNVPETFRDAAGNFVAAGIYKSPTVRAKVSVEYETRARELLGLKSIETKIAAVVKLPVVVAVKPLEQRTAAQALAAAGGMLGLKVQRPAAVQVA